MMRAFLPIVCQRCIVDVYTDSSTLILCRSWMFFFSRRPLHSVWHRLLFYSAALVSNSHFMPDTTLFFQLIFHFIISHYHLVPGRWRVRWFVFHSDASMINFMWRKYGLILSFLFAFHSYLCNFIAPNSVCALLLCCWLFSYHFILVSKLFFYRSSFHSLHWQTDIFFAFLILCHWLCLSAIFFYAQRMVVCTVRVFARVHEKNFTIS